MYGVGASWLELAAHLPVGACLLSRNCSGAVGREQLFGAILSASKRLLEALLIRLDLAVRRRDGPIFPLKGLARFEGCVRSKVVLDLIVNAGDTHLREVTPRLRLLVHVIVVRFEGQEPLLILRWAALDSVESLGAARVDDHRIRVHVGLSLVIAVVLLEIVRLVEALANVTRAQLVVRVE